MLNRMEHTINNLSVTTENMTAAESRIRDVDMANEMMAYTKNDILVQASIKKKRLMPSERENKKLQVMKHHYRELFACLPVKNEIMQGRRYKFFNLRPFLRLLW